jgi:hypothetical protein
MEEGFLIEVKVARPGRSPRSATGRMVAFAE